jgi:hypothetical protein
LLEYFEQKLKQGFDKKGIKGPKGVSKPGIIYVKWPSVTMREGPGTNFKTLVEV